MKQCRSLISGCSFGGVPASVPLSVELRAWCLTDLVSLPQYVTVQTISGTGALRIGASFLVSLEMSSAKGCRMTGFTTACVCADPDVDLLSPQPWKTSHSLINELGG